jgi:hypothetical protein
MTWHWEMSASNVKFTRYALRSLNRPVSPLTRVAEVFTLNVLEALERTCQMPSAWMCTFCHVTGVTDCCSFYRKDVEALALAVLCTCEVAALLLWCNSPCPSESASFLRFVDHTLLDKQTR